jgi:NAD(P)-dependent dehydrogenase (short-subunit alcohol dehydrogenase family)
MGRAAAECFAEDGARVAVLARTKSAVDEVAESLRRAGSPDTLGLVADLSEPAQVDDAFRQVGERWGHLNALVNTVGPGAPILGSFEQLDDVGWELAFDLMTMGAVRTCRAALPLLRAAEWGRIVNVSAHSVKRQSPTLVAYTAGKSALTSLTKNLSLTLAPDGILVNTVSPGTFLTAQIKHHIAGPAAAKGVDPNDLVAVGELLEEEFGDALGHLGRAGLPSEIGVVIAFLASKRNSFMTGADVNVDGGSDFT